MYMIQITEDKFDKLAENAEKMLRYGGKVMSCIDSLQQSSGRMNERYPIPDYRGRSRGSRSNMRQYDDYERHHDDDNDYEY